MTIKLQLTEKQRLAMVEFLDAEPETRMLLRIQTYELDIDRVTVMEPSQGNNELLFECFEYILNQTKK